jgi:hypothetical protein
MIIHQGNISYQQHCRTSCGTYVLAHNEPDQTNTKAPRALDCLYLRPNASGRQECLHLQTNRVITRRSVTPLPITPAIITLIHKIAEQDGMLQGLKIANRYGTILYDSSWIAGVDFDNEQFEEEDKDYDHDEPYDNNDHDADDDEDDDDYDDNENNVDEMDPNEVADILQDRAQNAGVQGPPQDAPAQQEEIVFEGEEPPTEEETEDTPAEEEEDPSKYKTRSGLLSRPTPHMNMYQAQQHLSTEKATVEEYSQETAQVIATVMGHWNNICRQFDETTLAMFIQTYSLNKGIKKFGQKGKDAAIKELKQLHNRTVFEGIKIKDMTPLERKRAMESLLFLVEKRNGKIKARTCANGSTQREYIDREDATSPTAATEAILITGVIDAKQRRDIMTNDVPNTFVQTPIPHKMEKRS